MAYSGPWTIPEGFLYVGIEGRELPAAVAGVITLEADQAYFFVGDTDLNGDRLVASQDTVILGSSSEVSVIRSTGLAAGTALLSSAFTLPMRHVTLTHATAIALDASANAGQVLDWMGVNFLDCSTEVGLIKNYVNVIMSFGAHLNSGPMRFDGSIDTVAINTELITVATGLVGLLVESTCTINRRFRMNLSAMVVAHPTSTGIKVESLASFPLDQTFILDTVNIAGGGTFLDGIDFEDNAALFDRCVGITNSFDAAQYDMQGNAVATSIPVQNTFVKIAGTTTPGSVVSKFDLSVTQRAKYIGALVGQSFQAIYLLSFTDGPNKTIAFELAKNDVPIADTRIAVDTGGGSSVANVTVGGLVQLDADDYVELWITNESSGSGTATVTDMKALITRIPIILFWIGRACAALAVPGSALSAAA